MYLWSYLHVQVGSLFLGKKLILKLIADLLIKDM